MRTVIREETSSWRNVTSGVPQGSVLAPIMFQIYVNDMQCGVTSYMNMFADDTKLMRVIKNMRRHGAVASASGYESVGPSSIPDEDGVDHPGFHPSLVDKWVPRAT